MKSFFKYAGIFLILVVAAVYAFREPLKQTAYDELTKDMFVDADEDSFDPGPAVGSAFPEIRASHRGKTITGLGDYAGSKGTALVATRSADWCPYCMKQMIQLQDYKAGFDEAGIGLVAITYDAPALQQAFIAKHGIEYPILHDLETASFRSLGILNEQYQPGNDAYGIPHPGMIVIDPAGRIVGKLFLEAYSYRVSADASLAFAQRVLGITP